jgi:AcrR family transcriptional regulator
MSSVPTDATARTPRATGHRTDGEASRERLLQAGLRLFAQQGYARTSTRELAESAQVNVAAISYYFGDKAGLYRAVFFEPLGAPEDDIAGYVGAGMTLPEALRGFFAGMLEPLRMGDSARLCVKLRFREMLEPTGLWDEEVTHGIKPMHDALVAVLCRHFGLATADDELQRLAVAITGLAVHLHVAHDVIDAVAPQLNGSGTALDLWLERLPMYAQAMIDAEQQRRAGALRP